MTQPLESLLERLRGQGWAVAVHNDYRLGGEARTFWGLSRGAQWIQGEAASDAAALELCQAAAHRLCGPPPSAPPEVRLAITESWARQFRKAAAEMPIEPPAKVDPILWCAQAQALLGQAETLEEEAAQLRAEIGREAGLPLDGQ